MMRSWLLIGSVLILTACGQTGPLYLPAPPVAPVPVLAPLPTSTQHVSS